MVGVNLNEQVLSTIEYLRPEMSDENIYFSLILFTELWNTRIEPDDIRKLLVTLLVESCESLGNGGRITIETANQSLRGADALDGRPELTPGDYVSLSLTNTSASPCTSNTIRLLKRLHKVRQPTSKSASIPSSITGFIRKSGGDIVRCDGLGPVRTISVYFPRCAQLAEDSNALPLTGVSVLK